jgi:hypothetical protein
MTSKVPQCPHLATQRVFGILASIGISWIVMWIQMISGEQVRTSICGILIWQAAANPMASRVLPPAMWIQLVFRTVFVSSNKNRDHWLLKAEVSGTAAFDDRQALDLWGRIDRHVARMLHAMGPN